jgi:hypothetical protein
MASIVTASFTLPSLNSILSISTSITLRSKLCGSTRPSEDELQPVSMFLLFVILLQPASILSTQSSGNQVLVLVSLMTGLISSIFHLIAPFLRLQALQEARNAMCKEKVNVFCTSMMYMES